MNLTEFETIVCIASVISVISIPFIKSRESNILRAINFFVLALTAYEYHNKGYNPNSLGNLITKLSKALDISQTLTYLGFLVISTLIVVLGLWSLSSKDRELFNEKVELEKWDNPYFKRIAGEKHNNIKRKK
jgi:hypothetical protein